MLHIDREKIYTMAYETTMVELDGGWVLEDIPPPAVRSVFILCVRLGKELICWWCKTTAHEREFVVEETSVKASNKCSYKRVSAGK